MQNLAEVIIVETVRIVAKIQVNGKITCVQIELVLHDCTCPHCWSPMKRSLREKTSEQKRAKHSQTAPTTHKKPKQPPQPRTTRETEHEKGFPTSGI